MDPVAETEFRAWAAARQGAMFRTAFLLTGHRQDAEDLLQGALAKLAQRWTRISSDGSPDAYVRRILYHDLISWRRLARNRRERAHPDVGDFGVTADSASTSAVRLAVAQALARLTPRQRTVIVLRFYSDLPEAEVAKIMSCSIGTVRSQTHRTLARLRTMCPELSEILETV
jgi:RNA polymerase sigma-70 factor (sigma-E family)